MENKLEKIGQNTDFTESDFEKSIPSNSQRFLIELGKGYTFVARRQPCNQNCSNKKRRMKNESSFFHTPLCHILILLEYRLFMNNIF